jgi:hypothetical protein
VQVGVQIGLDDIERLQEEEQAFERESTRPVIRGGGFGVGLSRQLAESSDSLGLDLVARVHCTARKLPLGSRPEIPRLASQGRVKSFAL